MPRDGCCCRMELAMRRTTARVLAVVALLASSGLWHWASPARSPSAPGGCLLGSGTLADSKRPHGVTESGHRCLDWSRIPKIAERFPNKGLGDHAFCRNPDGRRKPWCFIRNQRGRIDWAYCNCRHETDRARLRPTPIMCRHSVIHMKHSSNQLCLVRLQGDVHPHEGRVEVYVNGKWGLICNKNWDNRDASVVCRQLGYSESGNAGQVLVSGLVLIHWSNVQCRGDEYNLFECVKETRQRGDCFYKRAASVTCYPPKAPVFVPIRLVGGSSEYEGRVEVYRSGQWGTVCDDHWDEADAEVVCRQLGISSPAKAQPLAYFGEGSGPILLDDVQCTGNELSIDQCPKSLWGDHNCGHKEDAGVSCNPLRNGAVRLVGGKGSHEGRLEVYYGGEWGTVCDDGWTEQNAQVVCRQLGFRYAQNPPERRFEGGSGPIYLDDVRCSGQESSLSFCPRSEWGKHDCSHHEDVTVICTHNAANDIQGILFGPPIRLMDGENKKEGRVEIFINGQWGTICDDGWTDEDATVVCHQLGYEGPAKARSLAYFGDGVGPIHLDNVKCTGSEESLSDCIKQDIGTHNCRHSEDASVICDYQGKKPGNLGNIGPTSTLCGLRLLNQRQKRIIGGKNSLRGGWPWQAAIRLRTSHGDGRLLCGATLIDSCWVLTAAHCFKRYGNSTKNYIVRVGDYHTLVPEEYEERFEVKRIIIHKGYRPDANDYDIALVKLEGHQEHCAKFSAHVLPVCLPHRREQIQKRGSNCYITGWGDTGRAYSKTLQQAAIPLLPRRHCEERYKQRFTGRMICAGNLLDHKRVDSCQGDSGGPLVCEKARGHWVVFGVTSWGHGCGVKDTPGVYTKVSTFIPWIKRVTKL
ncbi:neurotrypsin isoform X4 [Chiloscyllium punctatum]|uniref:neurotrypsin isoform X4 n=1 Tax=Chiloscyllium punctatum TaxID=137246 RepID=UPI003B63FBF6